MGNGAFENGQTYVALSRCVGMRNLYLLRPITPRDIKVNQSVAEFMRHVNSEFFVDEQTKLASKTILLNDEPQKTLLTDGNESSKTTIVPQNDNPDQQIININDNDAKEILSLYTRLNDTDKKNFKTLLEKWKSRK
jgi:hypothetical protein